MNFAILTLQTQNNLKTGGIGMKKLLSLLLSICMAASILVGCGAQKMENPGNTANDKLAETESITDEVREKKKQVNRKKLLSVWYVWELYHRI